MLKNKKKMLITFLIVLSSLVFIFLIISILTDKKDISNNQDGVIVGVGDNNNDNNGDKVTVDNNDTTKVEDTKEEETTEAPRHVDEQIGKVAGNWAVSDGGSVFEFIPDRGNEATLYFRNKDLYIKGTYETDDKTYIKVQYADVYDSSVTGTIEFEIKEMVLNYFGEITMILVDKSDNTEYYLTPANIFG